MITHSRVGRVQLFFDEGKEKVTTMPRGREHKPARAVRTSRDGAEVELTPKVSQATLTVDTPSPEAARHAALCRLVAQGFDRVEASGRTVTVDHVALAGLVAAAYILPPASPARAIATKAWDIAEAWVEARNRHLQRHAEAAKKEGSHGR